MTLIVYSFSKHLPWYQDYCYILGIFESNFCWTLKFSKIFPLVPLFPLWTKKKKENGKKILWEMTTVPMWYLREKTWREK